MQLQNVMMPVMAVLLLPFIFIFKRMISSLSLLCQNCLSKKKRSRVLVLVLEEGEKGNQFDRLPIPLILQILEKVRDADSLSRCMCVSKLFASVVPRIRSLSLSVVVCRGNNSYNQLDFQVEKPAAATVLAGRFRERTYFNCLIQRIVANSPMFLLRLLHIRPTIPEQQDDECKFHYYSVKEVLKSFTEIQSLELKIHGNGGGDGIDDEVDSPLKWRAEFRSDLECCFILGRKSFIKTRNATRFIEEEEVKAPAEPPLSDREVTLRVVWTVSCLNAASVRYELLKQVVSDQRKLRRVVVSDTIGKGKLIMRKEQIEKMRKSIENGDKSVYKTLGFDALKMKMWYVPKLELPLEGRAIEGSTLVVIRAVDHNQVERDEDSLERIWGDDRKGERELVEAMKEMMKMKTEKVCTLKLT